MFNRASGRTKEGGSEPDLPTIVPHGTLVSLSVDQVRKSPDNPRQLFDPEPLAALKKSIKAHGVLVPITVYKLPAQDKYAIVDGERRYRCCVELGEEGHPTTIPANVVEVPDGIASLVYMFNIHAFREQWELMPTAISLGEVMRLLNTEDSAELHQVTGLSMPQIERCKIILTFPESFQRLSLDPDPTKRIRSNFWVELYPVLGVALDVVPDLYADLGRDGITSIMVEKYRAKKIKSIIHLREICEAAEFAVEEEDRQAVADRLREYILDPELETREAFGEFVRDPRRVQKATGACNRFLTSIRRARVDYAIEGKEEIVAKLIEVIAVAQTLLDRLQGVEPPDESAESKDPYSATA